ncbi:MAG: TolC family protein [Elusimicrobia bacterium]|nr:TolC family protein [Elusimicrobiota bacterium]
MTNRACGFLWALALIAGVAPGALAAPLTLAQCLTRARSRSTQAVQAALAEGRAKAAHAEAVAGLRPQLLINGRLTRSDDASTNLPDDNNATLRLQQSLDPLAPEWAQADQRAAEARAAELSRVETSADVDLQIKQLYFSILQDQDAVASIQKVSEETKKLLDNVLPKFEMGRAPAFDPVKVRLSLADLSLARGLAQSRLDGERETLAMAVGLADSPDLDLAPVLVDTSDAATDLSTSAVQGNPTFGTLEQEVRAAELGLTAARRARWPDLTGALEYGYADYTTSGMSRGWAATLNLSMPLYDWGRISAQISRQDGAVREANNRLEARRQEASAQIVRALGEAAAHARDQRALAAILPDVRQAALIEVQRYRLGAAGILEATDAVNLWLNTLLQERASYYSLLADQATLERLTGGRFTAAYDR